MARRRCLLQQAASQVVPLRFLGREGRQELSPVAAGVVPSLLAAESEGGLPPTRLPFSCRIWSPVASGRRMRCWAAWSCGPNREKSLAGFSSHGGGDTGRCRSPPRRRRRGVGLGKVGERRSVPRWWLGLQRHR